MKTRFTAQFLAPVILTFIGAVSTNAQGGKNQSKPDLSGSWLLDSKKSNSAGLTSKPDLPVKISHHDPEFRVTLSSELNGQTVERDFVYFTDGRGETNPATSFLTTEPRANPGDLQKQVTKSKSKWSGDKIVTRSQLRATIAGTFVEFEQVDEWKLSSDGKVLSQTSRIIFQQSNAAFVPAMVPDKKKVYNRL